MVNGGESERRIVVGWQRERIGVNKVVEGTTLVEAMNLPTVMSFEDVEELVEEVLYFDDRLIGEWRQVNRVRLFLLGDIIIIEQSFSRIQKSLAQVFWRDIRELMA